MNYEAPRSKPSNPNQLTGRLTPTQKKLAAWSLAAAVTVGTLGAAIHKNNEVNTTPIPTPAEAQAHPDDFTTRKVQPGETLDEIAREYTKAGNDYRAGTDHLADQNGGTAAVQAGQELQVPVTTVPPEDR